MRVDLLFKRAGKGVVDTAGFDDDVFAGQHDGVFRRMAKLAIAERDIVGGDFYERCGRPVAVDQKFS